MYASKSECCGNCECIGNKKNDLRWHTPHFLWQIALYVWVCLGGDSLQASTGTTAHESISSHLTDSMIEITRVKKYDQSVLHKNGFYINTRFHLKCNGIHLSFKASPSSGRLINKPIHRSMTILLSVLMSMENFTSGYHFIIFEPIVLSTKIH